MSYTPQQAYDAIKNLEKQTTFPLPLTTATVDVGSFDASTNAFNYSVPTETQTYTIPSRIGPNGKPTGPITISILVAVVPVYAVNLILRFTVKNPKHNFKVQMGPYVQSINTDQVVAVSDTMTAAATSPAKSGKAQKATIKVRPFPGPIVIGPFAPRSISLNVGVWSPPAPDGAHPPGVQVTMWSGTATTQIQLVIARPPIFTAGAFTLPALPLSIIYAPPVGAQSKNFAEYTHSVSVGRKIATGTSSSHGTKQATAYGNGEFVGKASSTVSVLKTMYSGAFQGAALAYFNVYGAFLDVCLNLLGGTIPDITSNTTTTGTTSTEHDEIVTNTDLTSFGSTAGLGPGAGDRFVYLRNVKVAYIIANNQLSYTVLGSDGIRAFGAQQLIDDLTALQSSNGAMRAGPTTNLDTNTLQSLLSLDPFINNPSPTLAGPRFVQNDPPSAGGSGTGPNGDTFTVTHDFTTVDISTATAVTTTVTDFKPGWLDALFDGTQATEDTVSTTYSYTGQTTVDEQQSATVHFFAAPSDPPYLVGLYFDRLFGTFAYTPWSGALLKKTDNKPKVKPRPKAKPKVAKPKTKVAKPKPVVATKTKAAKAKTKKGRA